MTQSPAWWRILVLSTIVLCIAFSMKANGQGGKSALFATVDVQKLNENFVAKKALEKQFQDLQTQWNTRLARRDNLPFLTVDEQNQLDAAIDKGGVIDPKAKELTDKGNALTEEMNKLSQKPQAQLVEADTKRIKELETIRQKTIETFNTLKEQMTNELKNFDALHSDELLKQIRTAVATVAKQKDVSIVFNSQVALYAGNDITDAVVNVLNKK